MGGGLGRLNKNCLLSAGSTGDSEGQLELAVGVVGSRGGGGATGSDIPITTLLSMKYMNLTGPFPSSDAKPPSKLSSLKASAAVGTRLLLTHRVSAVGISTLSSYTSGNACEWLHMAVLSMATCALQAQQMPVDAVL